MGYKDKDKQREFCRKWMAKRRADFFADKSCELCGSKNDLCLHHLKPEEKESHRIWSWSQKRREAEIKKCQVICEPCHINVHRELDKLTRSHGLTLYEHGCRCDICYKAKQRNNARRKLIATGVIKKFEKVSWSNGDDVALSRQ